MIACLPVTPTPLFPSKDVLLGVWGCVSQSNTQTHFHLLIAFWTKITEIRNGIATRSMGVGVFRMMAGAGKADNIIFLL